MVFAVTLLDGNFPHLQPRRPKPGLNQLLRRRAPLGHQPASAGTCGDGADREISARSKFPGRWRPAQDRGRRARRRQPATSRDCRVNGAPQNRICAGHNAV